MKILVAKILEPWWMTPEEAEELSDQDIVELVMEDVSAFLDGATWAVEREHEQA